MRKFIHDYFGAATLVLVGVMGAVAQTSDPAGPTKPVVVVNTSANPVPVTGTVTGTVTGSVSITNAPTVKIDSAANTIKIDSGSNTVKIDPTANKVEVDGGSTDQLLYLNDYDFRANLLTGIGPIDVSKYKQIRVVALLYPSSEGDLGFDVATILPDGSVLALDPSGDSSLSPGERYSRVFDVPGKSIKILLGAGPGQRVGRIAIFGR